MFRRLALILASIAALLMLTACAGVVTDEPLSAKPTATQQTAFLSKMRAAAQAKYGSLVHPMSVSTVYGTEYRDCLPSSIGPNPKVYQYAIRYELAEASVPFVVVYPRDVNPDDVVSILSALGSQEQAALRAYSKVESAPAIGLQGMRPSDIKGMPPGKMVWRFSHFDVSAASDSFLGSDVILLEDDSEHFRRLPLSSWQ